MKGWMNHSPEMKPAEKWCNVPLMVSYSGFFMYLNLQKHFQYELPLILMIEIKEGQNKLTLLDTL
jgi:hypothetical protein